MARLPTTRQTPSVPRVGLGGRISVARFFGEVISELRKVNWPTRQETTRLTVLVLAIAVSMGIFLGAIDYLFSLLFERIAS